MEKAAVTSADAGDPVGAPADPRRRILEAAAQILAVEGYDGARLRSIAKTAGVSIGLLQHYFETRDALLSDALTWATGELIGHWAGLADEQRDPWQRLAALVESLTMRGDLRARSMAWTEFCASSARHPELRPAVKAVYDEWRQLMAGVIQAGIESGAFRPQLPAGDVADLLVSQVDGCEMAIAADVGMLDGERFHHLVLAAAAVLLGVSPANVHAPGSSTRSSADAGTHRPKAGAARAPRARRKEQP